MLPLSVLMNRNIKKINFDATVKEAAKLMRDHKVGSLFVEKGNTYVGILSETDIVRRGLAEGINPELELVEKLMSSPIISIDISRPVLEVNDLMAKKGIRHLAVTEYGKIVGVVSVRKLLICFKNRF